MKQRPHRIILSKSQDGKVLHGAFPKVLEAEYKKGFDSAKHIITEDQERLFDIIQRLYEKYHGPIDPIGSPDPNPYGPSKR